MKRIASLLLLSFILLNCKKDNPALTIKQDLAGKWELKTRYGGWIGTQNFPEGNGNTIEFSGDNYTRVLLYNGDEYRDSGTFNVYSDSACDGIGQTVYISFVSQPVEVDVEDVSLTNGALIFGQNSCIADGTTSIYRKIR